MWMDEYKSMRRHHMWAFYYSLNKLSLLPAGYSDRYSGDFRRLIDKYQGQGWQ
jgi:hypothetical protein